MTSRFIDEGAFVEINKLEQWVCIRGKKPDHPVLLILSGPGVALSAIAPFFEPWEQHFTLAFWDQPGSGATYAQNPDGQPELNLARLVDDGVAVCEYLKQRLQLEKLALLGISAGSIVGLQMVQQRPELFSAYIGTGQFVNWAQQDAVGYEKLLAKAQAESDVEAERQLLEIGPPPYSDAATDAIKSTYHSALTGAEQAMVPVFSALMTEALTNPPADAGYIPAGLTLVNPRELAMHAYGAMRSELVGFDAWQMPMVFRVPMFFFQGDHDFYSVTSVVEQYVSDITAPVKNTVEIEDGSHSVFWQRERFLAELKRHVVPLL